MATVPTSAGEIDVADLGVVLMHEHVFIRTEQLHWGWPGFGGWDEEQEVAAAGPASFSTTTTACSSRCSSAT